jgi:hypothetical protein
MCQPNKFFEGKLVYFFRLKAVGIIGHCCASTRTRNAAQIEYDQREARQRGEDYLVEWIPQVPRYRARGLALRPTAAEAQRVYDRFRKDGGKFQQALRRAAKGGGELTVTEIVGAALAGGPAGLRTSGSSVETRDIRFGTLAGRAVVGSRCSILADLDTSLAMFQTFDRGVGEDAALDFVISLADDGKAGASKSLHTAILGVAEAEHRLIEFRSFFGEANLQRITAWGSHPEAPVAMSARLSEFGDSRRERLFELRGADGRRLGIVIDPVLWTDFVVLEDPDLTLS